MNETEPTVEHYAIVALIFIVIALLALPVAIGFLLGAGAGWLIFALICFGLAVSAIKRAKDKKKAESPQVSE